MFVEKISFVLTCVQKTTASLKVTRTETVSSTSSSGLSSKMNNGSRTGCPHLIDHGEGFVRFTDQVLGWPLDVEDLSRSGSSLGICPYYGGRKLLAEADLVLVPYSAILSQDTRDSLGLVLKGNAVVFDEAHNLVDAVNGAHSCSVGLHQLRGASRWARYIP